MPHPIAIEFNDSGIIVSDGPQLLLESPGYLITRAEQEWVGKDARERALLYPNDCDHRFWSKLARTKSGAVNQADAALALRHLESIWNMVSADVDAVILTVPATFTKTGLGILLGICTELSIPVRAMIHHAALSPRQAGHEGVTLHVDMQLHHTAVTRLDEKNKEFIAAHSEILENTGFHSIYTCAAKFISQSFISNTRLDPLHSAELEQQLFNKLPSWLETAQVQTNVRCQLEYQSSPYEVLIDTEELKGVLNSEINKIVTALLSLNSAAEIVACTPELVERQLGFSRYVGSHGILVRPLPLGFHAKQSLQHTERLLAGDAQIYLNKQLPYSIRSDALPQVSDMRMQKIETPTHILYRNRAFPLNGNLYISGAPQTGLHVSNDQTQTPLVSIRRQSSTLVIEAAGNHEVTVNDQIVKTYTQPVVGDCIRIAAGADELVFIKVNS